jgi:hypothetical protein
LLEPAGGLWPSSDFAREKWPFQLISATSEKVRQVAAEDRNRARLVRE